MNNIKNAVISFFQATSPVKIALFAVLILSIPITILLVKQQQDIRQRAQSTETCTGTDCPTAGTIRKEGNVNVCYFGERTCDSEGQCTIAKCNLNTNQICQATQGCIATSSCASHGSGYQCRNQNECDPNTIVNSSDCGDSESVITCCKVQSTNQTPPPNQPPAQAPKKTTSSSSGSSGGSTGGTCPTSDLHVCTNDASNCCPSGTDCGTDSDGTYKCISTSTGGTDTPQSPGPVGGQSPASECTDGTTRCDPTNTNGYQQCRNGAWASGLSCGKNANGTGNRVCENNTHGTTGAFCAESGGSGGAPAEGSGSGGSSSGTQSGGQSAEKTITVVARPPDVPNPNSKPSTILTWGTNPLTVEPACTGLIINWKNITPPGEVQGFRLKYGINSKIGDEWDTSDQDAIKIEKDKFTYILKDLTPGVEYAVKMGAVDKNNNIAWTGVLTGIPQPQNATCTKTDQAQTVEPESQGLGISTSGLLVQVAVIGGALGLLFFLFH